MSVALNGLLVEVIVYGAAAQRGIYLPLWIIPAGFCGAVIAYDLGRWIRRRGWKDWRR